MKYIVQPECPAELRYIRRISTQHGWTFNAWRDVSKAGVAPTKTLGSMSFFTYILECSDGKFYTGFTYDLDARIIAQNTGEYPNAFTLRRRPVKLVFYEEFEDAENAKEFVSQIKKWTRVKKQALIEDKWDKLRELSRKKFSKQ